MSEKILFMQKELQTKLIEAQDHQALYFDQNHLQRTFHWGDQVMLIACNLKTTWSSKKLDNKALGLFTITKEINEQAYKLSLPKSMQIHPVFHVSLLKPYYPNKLINHSEPPPPPIGVITDDRDN